jgi:hypothetical protein
MGEPNDTLNDPAYWRGRAAEARAQAELLSDPEERRQMLVIAQAFARLADRVSQRRDRSLN